MKMAPECIPCLLQRVLYETGLVDRSMEMEVMRASVEVLSRRLAGSPVSVDVATEVHLRAYGILGTDDPYREQKRRANEVARRLMPVARELVGSAEDPLEAAATVAVTGNVLDFGIKGGLNDPDLFERMFLSMFREGLGASDLPRMRSLLVEGARVPYLVDNCGEIILDAILVEHLVGLGCVVDVVVKGAPILSDATMSDAVEAGLDRIASRVLTTGSAYVGLDWNALPPDTKASLSGADLIVSKGMGNFEALTELELPPVAYLMRTKCLPVATAAGAPLGVNAAILRSSR
ncbi:MAG: ARMT1-like domain-containing protein [Thermoplasmata archaeon]|nr:ARMT1-like domain-containing protein [Thermoplasmata archaeon]